MRRGQIQRRSLDECWLECPAGCCTGPVYIPPPPPHPPDFKVVQVRSAFCILHSHWSLTWDSVDAERAGRSEDASSKHSWVTGWFQAEVLEMANFYWPLTSAGSLRWKPNFHWLMAQAGSRGQPRGMLNFHWPRRPTASLYGFLPVLRPPTGSSSPCSGGLSSPLWFPSFAMGSPLRDRG